jgi:elongation factor P
MILASDIKEGMTLDIDGRLYRVLEAGRHSGAGQQHGFVEVSLHDVKYNHFYDRHFKYTDKVKEVDLVKRQMEFLYADAEACWFMDPLTFEQVSVPKETIGKTVKLLKEGLKIVVELLGEEAVFVQFPKVIEMKVLSTGEGKHEAQDNTMKTAILENDIEMQVPHFVVSGDTVRIDTEKMKYMDRVAGKRV